RRGWARSGRADGQDGAAAAREDQRPGQGGLRDLGAIRLQRRARDALTEGVEARFRQAHRRSAHDAVAVRDHRAAPVWSAGAADRRTRRIWPEELDLDPGRLTQAQDLNP